jgi:hypothetical protein
MCFATHLWGKLVVRKTGAMELKNRRGNISIDVNQ